MDMRQTAKILLALAMTTGSSPVAAADPFGPTWVVTRDEIRSRGYRSISDLLDRLPGIVTHHNPATSSHYATVRGLAMSNNGTGVGVYLNGHRITNVNESADLAWPITLDNVEKVEVTVGPSLMHSPESLAAVINLVTMDMDGKEIVLSAGAGEIGKSAGSNAAFRATNNLPDRQTSLNAAGTLMVGKKESDTRSIFASGTLVQDEGFNTYLGGRKDGLLLERAGFVEPSHFVMAAGRLDDWGFQAHSIHQALHDRFSASNRNSYSDGGRISRKRTGERVTSGWTFSSDTHRASKWNSSFDWWQKVYGLDWGLEHKGERASTRGGAQFRLMENRNTYGMAAFKPKRSQAEQTTTVRSLVRFKDTYTTGVYLAQDRDLSPTVKLALAGRADRHSWTDEGGTYFSPHAAAAWTPSEKGSVVLSHRRSIKFPEPLYSTLRTYRSKIYNTANATSLPPAKSPERLAVSEVRVTRVIGRARLGTAAYYQELKDMIAFAQDNTQWTNVGTFRGHGVELTLEAPMGERIRLWANGSWTEGTFTTKKHLTLGADPVESPDQRLSGVPRYLANIGADWRLSDSASLTPQLRWFDDQAVQRTWYDVPTAALPAKAGGNPVFWDRIRHRYYVDIAYLQKLGPSLTLRMTAKNALDNRKLIGRPPERSDATPDDGDMAPAGRRLELTAFYHF